MNLLKYIHAWIIIIKNLVLDYRAYRKDSTAIKFVRGKKYAFIFLAANYDNLGDLAITYAQECYLRNNLGAGCEIVKVYDSETYAVARQIKKLNKEDVIITLIGGGNNGSLYEFLEHPRRFLLLTLSNYNIISFPQTVYFENSFSRLPYKQTFKFVCNRCRNLTLIAREQLSYERYLAISSKANVALTPDIVFSLKFTRQENGKRNGVALILRDDIEKAMGLEVQNRLIAHIEESERDVYFCDTCDVIFNNDNSEKLIKDYLSMLSGVKYAVTDRLHGMILCYISKTPCIVIDNNNGKVSSTFNTWLLNQNFIKMYKEDSNIEHFDEIVMELKNVDVKYEALDSCFQPIEEILRNGCNE